MSSFTKGCLPLKVIFHQRSSSTDWHIPPKVIFHLRLSFAKGCLPTKIIFHRSLPSSKGRLLTKVVFHWRLPSTEGCLVSNRLPAKVVFHRRWSSNEGHLPANVVSHRRRSSTEGSLPLKVVLHRRLSSMYHSRLVICLKTLPLQKCPFSSNDMRATWTIWSNFLGQMWPCQKSLNVFWTNKTEHMKQIKKSHVCAAPHHKQWKKWEMKMRVKQAGAKLDQDKALLQLRFEALH